MVKGSFDIVAGENQRRETLDQNSDSNGPVSQRNISYSATLSHILVVSIGPTIFILPKAFAMVGYLNATIGIVLISVLYAYNLHSLLNSSFIVHEIANRSDLSFAEIVKYAFEKGRIDLKRWAPFMYQFMNVLFVVSWGGELSFTVVFLANNLQDLCGSWGDSLNLQWIIGALLVPCTLLTLIPYEKLACLSAVTSFIDIFFVAIVMYDILHNFETSWFDNCEAVRPLQNIPQFLAIVFFTLNFTGLAIPSRNLMKKPKQFESAFGVLHASLTIITCANIIFGFSGYLRYGQKVRESIILNLTLNNVLLRISLALFCLATYFSYPFLYFVLFNIVWEEWMMKLCSDDTRINDSRTCKMLTSVSTNVLLFAIILSVPNLELFTNLGGLVCGVMDSFVIPAILQILLYSKYAPACEFRAVLIKNLVILSLGMVIFVFGLQACMESTIGI